VLLSIIFYIENRAVYEIIWQNIVEIGRSEITKQYGACAFCVR